MNRLFRKKNFVYLVAFSTESGGSGNVTLTLNYRINAKTIEKARKFMMDTFGVNSLVILNIIFLGRE
jgi:hypothetical protein